MTDHREETVTEAYDRCFKFKPGDVVCLSVIKNEIDAQLTLSRLDKNYDRLIIPRPYFVLERYGAQCSGGVQFWYTVADHSRPDAAHHIKMRDDEVISFEEGVAYSLKFRGA